MDSHHITLDRLSQSHATPFDVTLDQEHKDRIIDELDLMGLEDLRFTGDIAPEAKGDWHLTGTLVARVIQPCAITLAPVVTEVEERVERRYLADWNVPEGQEVEMPEDVSAEPKPDVVNLLTVIEEELRLTLPDFPRTQDAELDHTLAAPEGSDPLTDSDAKPFASLAALRDKLSDED